MWGLFYEIWVWDFLSFLGVLCHFCANCSLIEGAELVLLSDMRESMTLVSINWIQKLNTCSQDFCFEFIYWILKEIRSMVGLGFLYLVLGSWVLLCVHFFFSNLEFRCYGPFTKRAMAHTSEHFRHGARIGIGNPYLTHFVRTFVVLHMHSRHYVNQP
jgi:hypothetical protein